MLLPLKLDTAVHEYVKNTFCQYHVREVWANILLSPVFFSEITFLLVLCRAAFTPHYRTLEVRPGRISKTLELYYDYDVKG